MSLQYPLMDLDNIKRYLESENEINHINFVLKSVQNKLPCKDTVRVLSFSFRKWVSDFCTSSPSEITEANIEIVYRLTMILEKVQISVHYDKMV